MPRFYFDFRQAGHLVPDSEGIEFSSVEQAYLEAFKTAQDMWSELLKQRQDPRRCLFEVRSAAGDMLFIFPFQEVVESCKDSKTPALQHTMKQMIDTFNYAKRVRKELADQVQLSQRVMMESRQLIRQVAELPPPQATSEQLFKLTLGRRN